MAFDAQQTVPHPADRIVEALASEDFSRQVIESFGGTVTSFETTGSPEGRVTVKAVRSLPADRIPDRVPDVVRKLVASGLTFEQEETWEAPEADGTRRGTMTIKVPVAKATAQATQTLTPVGEGTEYRINGEVTCKIPLVGGKLAKTAEPQVSKVVARQVRELDAWLNR